MKKWVNWNLAFPHSFTKKDLEIFSPQQKIEFFGQLLDQEPLEVEKLKEMQNLYDMNSTKNSEIKLLWIRIGLNTI